MRESENVGAVDWIKSRGVKVVLSGPDRLRLSGLDRLPDDQARAVMDYARANKPRLLAELKKGERRMQNCKDREFQYVALADLNLDSGYQQSPNRARVKQIVNGFDEKKLNPILCNMREDGRLFVLDGTHRVQAFREMGIDSILAEIRYGLSIKEEVELYGSDTNDRRRKTQVEIFLGRVYAKEAVPLNIEKILSTTGHYVAKATKKKSVSCVFVLERMYEKYPGVLERVWPLISSLCKDDGVTSFIVAAFVTLEVFLNEKGRTLLEKNIVNAIGKTTRSDFEKSLNALKDFLGHCTYLGPMPRRALASAINMRLRKKMPVDM